MMKSPRRSYLSSLVAKLRFGRAAKRKFAHLTRRSLRSPESLEDRRLMAGDIAGTVFNDLNANGVNDTTDPGLSGWTVFADTNADG
ncbi:MAG TPA: hypothetical protein PLV92_21000, partial [Pirellulaceae bacterium]|nr:hypothetical protein [Pirellulaceae bacterium]